VSILTFRRAMSLWAVVLICGLVIVYPRAAWSQVLYGSIVGNVRDSSGAAVPGVNVTITSKETNQVRTTVTNCRYRT